MIKLCQRFISKYWSKAVVSYEAAMTININMLRRTLVLLVNRCRLVINRDVK